MVKATKKGETDNWLTPDSAVYSLVPYLRKFKTIWCPFDLESSAFVQVLRKKVGVKFWLEKIF